MENIINPDVLEDDLLRINPELLDTLLRDHTTGSNIFWATDDYANKGEGFGFSDQITADSITGANGHVIMPRKFKPQKVQTARAKDMAEVFTPAWICNAQINLIDDAWFGRSGVFNTENPDHTWTPNLNPITFPEGKTWHDYVHDTRLEITCGEAPYIVSRFDVTTGETIAVGKRIGLLDRKMWLIHVNTPDLQDGMAPDEIKRIRKNWIRNVYRAFQSVYGFDWQGDNVLLAREALLLSFIEYYQAKWNTKELPQMQSLLKVAEIISWNIWQMDGLKYGIPGQTPKEFNESSELNFDTDSYVSPKERYCRVMEWKNVEPLKGIEVAFVTLLN